LKEGAKVCLVARRRDVLDGGFLVRFGGRLLIQALSPVSEAVGELVKAGCKADHILCVPGDVAKRGDLEAAAEATVAKFGKLDALVNAAGIPLPKEFEATSSHEVEHVLRVNVVGSANAVAACLPHLKKTGNGRIVLVSSMAGQVGLFGYTAYAASKFGLVGFAQALAMEVRRYNVFVSVLYPPDTDTPGFAEENKIKPAETAELSKV
jgi:3-dehydrosphinganine reductase